MLEFVRRFNLPSGACFVSKTESGYFIEQSLMQDVSMGGKFNEEVRNSLDPNVIWKHLIPVKDKLLMTVSTQKGCVHNCKFCDVAPLKFQGNLTFYEIMQQIDMLLKCFPEYNFWNGKDIISNKAKIGFSRMGEPAHNLDNVLKAIGTLFIDGKYKMFNWLPCFNSILPINNLSGCSCEEVIKSVLDYKEDVCGGMLHFQISCNSTDEEYRKKLFGGADVMTLPDVISCINKYPKITKRTVTLNFIVMENVPIDVDYLVRMGLNPERFVVKLIPLNTTNNSSNNELKSKYDYNTYDELAKYAKMFEANNIPVVYDSVCKAETAGLCCGQIVQNFIDDFRK